MKSEGGIGGRQAGDRLVTLSWLAVKGTITRVSNESIPLDIH